MEFMGEYYGERYIEININPTMKMSALFDFEALKDLYFTVELDVGASSYWSEIASMQTLDNLLMQDKIDTIEYLKRLPAGQITDRETLIAVLEASRQQQMAAQMGAMGVPVSGQAPGPTDEAQPPLRGGPGYGALQRAINQTGEIPTERGA